MFPLSQPQEGAVTFAMPDESVPFSERLKALAPTAVGVIGAVTAPQLTAERIGTEIGRNPKAYVELFGAAERQTMLVDTLTSRNIATEEAYDRRIKAVNDATGITLENPLRGGYRDEMARANREDIMIRAQRADQEVAEPLTGDMIFERKLAEARNAHPDKMDALTFGDIRAEAQAIAKGAEHEYEEARKNPKLDTAASLVTQFTGAMWGQRRDPLFVGSMFAGPTTAVGKTVGARIATSGLFQGLYNMGISALEQPAVQAWRQEIGLRSGMQPAAENVGLAFLFGAIPGAVFRGMHEIPAGLRPSVQRVLDGVPQAGDVEKAMQVSRMLESPERVEGAAYKINDQIFKAPIHALAIEDAMAAMGAQKEINLIDQQVGSNLSERLESHNRMQGFITSRGRFVERKEAQEIAERQGQIKEGKSPRLGGINAEDLRGKEGAAADQALGKYSETTEQAAIRLGEEMDAAERITQPRVVREVAPELRDDLTQAAQRYGDDPVNAPSPSGVAMVNTDIPPPATGFTRFYHGGVEYEGGPRWLTQNLDYARGYAGKSPVHYVDVPNDSPHLLKSFDDTGTDQVAPFVNFEAPEEIARGLKIYERPIPVEVSDRISAAEPRNLAEAQKAASEAIEDIGNRESIARTRTEMDADRLPLERIVAAAVVSADDRVFLGPNHILAADAARKAGADISNIFEGKAGRAPEGAFITSSGRLVSRQEAVEIGQRAEQITKSQEDLAFAKEKGILAEGIPSLKQEAKAQAVQDLQGKSRADLERKLPPASSKDPLDKIPMARDDGTPTLVSAKQAAKAGERETELSALIRECK